MRRGDLGQSLNLQVMQISAGKPNRPGTVIAPKKITIHNTSNTNRGANAAAHGKFVKDVGYYTLQNGQKNWVSWHYTVDDLMVVQHLPLNEMGWHAGPNGNVQSLGIEICMHQGINQDAAYDRAARLCACLLFDMKLKSNSVVTHKFWTGKNCPALLLQGNLWAKFLQTVEYYLNAITNNTYMMIDEEVVMDGVMCDEPSAAIVNPKSKLKAKKM